jgi:hypothetical protein
LRGYTDEEDKEEEEESGHVDDEEDVDQVSHEARPSSQSPEMSTKICFVEGLEAYHQT